MASYKCVLCGEEGTKDDYHCNKCGGRIMQDIRASDQEASSTNNKTEN